LPLQLAQAVHAALDGREVEGRTGVDDRLVILRASTIWDCSVLGPVDCVRRRQLGRPQLLRQPRRHGNGGACIAPMASCEPQRHDAALRMTCDDGEPDRRPAGCDGREERHETVGREGDLLSQTFLVICFGAPFEPGVIAFPRKNSIWKNKPSRGAKVVEKAHHICACVTQSVEHDNHGQSSVRICTSGNDLMVTNPTYFAALGV